MTEGEHIRYVNDKSDEEISALMITKIDNMYYSMYTMKSFNTYDEAYNANLEFLKQEYKEE